MKRFFYLCFLTISLRATPYEDDDNEIGSPSNPSESVEIYGDYEGENHNELVDYDLEEDLGVKYFLDISKEIK